MGKQKGNSGGGGTRAARAQAGVHKQKLQKAAILAKLAAPAQPDEDEDARVKELPTALKQAMLNVFSETLADTLASPDLYDAMQALKKALFDRDFDAAFGGDADKPSEATGGTIAPLDAYAARWSPTRALCYGSVLVSPTVQEHWNPNYKPKRVVHVDVDENDEAEDDDKEKEEEKEEEEEEEEIDDSPIRMVSIGGGAAELVAFAALLADGMPCEHRMGDLVLVDAGPWASVTHRLHANITTPVTVPTLEGDEDRVLVGPPARLAVDVQQLDILTVDDDAMAKLVRGAGAGSANVNVKTLVTLFFTLNELFTAGGLGAAATFLLRLTNAAPAGTVLLVVDSPGSYAETAVGSQAKRYPMKWLLDRFLTQDKDADSGAWEKVHEDDSAWHRLTSALTYPIRLEDMRYQTHLYVKL